MTDMKTKAEKLVDVFYSTFADERVDFIIQDLNNNAIANVLREAVNQILPEEEPIYKGGMRTGYDKTWRETKQDERQKARALFLELIEELQK